MQENMFLNKVLDWLFSVSGNDKPYRWKCDGLPKRAQFQSQVGTFSLEKENFKKLSEESLHKALEIIASDGWEVEREWHGGTIYCKRLPNYGKTYKYEGIVNIPPKTLNTTLFNNFEESPSWNSSVQEAKILQRFEENLNIGRFVASGPFCASRDFISLRTWRKLDDTFINCSFSVDYPPAPETNQFVRGQQGFCTYVMKPVDGEPEKTKLIWLMQAHLKGWLPQYVIDRTMWFGLTDHINSIKKLEKKKAI